MSPLLFVSELSSTVKMDKGGGGGGLTRAFPNLVFCFFSLGSVCRMKIPVPAPALPPLHLQPISNRTPPRNEKAKPA